MSADRQIPADSILERIVRAAFRVDRNPEAITLVAVTKTHPAETVEKAIALGLTEIGENRVQEAWTKKEKVQGTARWHLIGPLQRNKARRALEIFDVIHSIDRMSLVERLQSLMAQDRPGHRIPVLIQVNIGQEQQKAGCTVPETLSLAREILDNAPGLELKGLMTIPPFATDPEQSRPFFSRLRVLGRDLQQALGVSLPELSMGMSADFEIAVEEGATMLRIGSALFGARENH